MMATRMVTASAAVRSAIGHHSRQSLYRHEQHAQRVIRAAATAPVSNLDANRTLFLVRRTYATMPNQQQVLTKFAGPLREFLLIISRMARFVIYSVTGVAVIGFTAFEGMHQYIEHVAMPREQVGGGILDGSAGTGGDDTWGWEHDFSEETWVGHNSKGTDPRLGYVGRHQVRSAWSTLTWGGGLQPSSYLGAGGSTSPAAFGTSSKRVALYLDEGTRSAENFVLAALMTAEQKGIRLPDMAAIRAGLQTGAAAEHKPGQHTSPNQSIDKTAVMLEYRLASIRERVGGKEALRGALAGYTRLYDALASLAATNRAMRNEGNESGQPGIRTDRLVRLATKLGDLHGLLGNRPEAEQWLLHAVELSGGGAVHDSSTRHQDLFRNEILSGGSGQLARMPAEVQAGQAVKQIAGHADDAHQTSPSPIDTPPSPSLTRSLISSLLSLSALHAQPSDQSALEQALQYQASALRLTRVEMGRLSLSSDKSDIGAQLHELWLAHHDGLACVHVGETMYGIRAASKAHSFGSSLLTAVGLRSSNTAAAAISKHDQTLAWLDEARTRADSVLTKLAANASTRRPDDTLALSTKWTNASIDVRTQAGRLLRDAQRLRAAVEDMTSILTAKKAQ